jgi:hypothetical protein
LPTYIANVNPLGLVTPTLLIESGQGGTTRVLKRTNELIMRAKKNKENEMAAAAATTFSTVLNVL